MNRASANDPGPAAVRTGGVGGPAVLVLGLVAAGGLTWGLGLHDWVRPERLARLRAVIDGVRCLGPRPVRRAGTWSRSCSSCPRFP